MENKGSVVIMLSYSQPCAEKLVEGLDVCRLPANCLQLVKE